MARQAKIPTPRFNLKAHDAKADKDTPILVVLVFRYNKGRVVWSTGEKVKPKFWNNKKQRVRITVNNPGDSSINNSLNQIANIAVELFRQKEGEISIQDFKDELSYRTGRKDRPKALSNHLEFFPFIDDYIEKRKNAEGAKRGTWKILQTCFNHLKKFAEEKYNGVLTYEDIDFNFRREFVNWLYQKPRELSQNYAAKVLTIINQFMNASYNLDYHQNLNHKKPGWSIKKEKISNVVLSFEELERLAKLDLSKNKRLDRVRDLFLIGAYSGLRFSDFTRIKNENIIDDNGEKVIDIHTKKTGTRVVVPIFPVLDAVLKKYDYSSPPTISNQKFNEYIKEVCKLAKINNKVVKRRTIANKVQESVKEKWEFISTHTARRSFATNFYKAGFSTIELMMITGHSTEKQFMQYINIDAKQNAKNMAAKMASLTGISLLRKVN